MCYIIACNAQDSVESLFRDFINDDQYQPDCLRAFKQNQNRRFHGGIGICV